MSTDHPSSSTMGISLAEAKPSSSSANVHLSSSTSGTPTGAVSSKQNTEVEMANSSLCCIPINTATPATLGAPESNNLALQLVNGIRENMDEVQTAYAKLEDYRTRVSKQNEEASKMREKKIEEPLENKIEEASKTVKTLANSLSPSDGRPAEGPIETDVQQDIIELKKNVKNIRLQILSELKDLIPTSKSHHHGKYHTDDSTHKSRKSKKLDKKVPNLYKNEMLARRSEFKDFKELYDGLGSKQKLCLLCFSVFPEKEIIKKRFMFYWWTAEGFVAPVKDSEQTAEVLANEVFSELMAKRFIEPFSKKRTLAGWVNKCHMHPFVRAALITVARRAKFFDFDAEGNLYPKKDLEEKPIRDFSSWLVCLLAGEETLIESVAGRMENVHMLFNVDETVLNFEKPELFSRMKNINLLCLGRWQTSQTHHIEVEDTEFLEGLKNMKYLKFLSLQGISLIKDLPTFVSNLTNLTILDIRACPNLEKIPREIGLLKSLTHLDMSECYLLVNMPMEISTLIELEVLKGFVVGESEGKDQKDSCTLGHLVGLTKLRKLSIFTGLKSFPSDSDLRDLNQLKKLLTLSIEWGRDVQGKSEDNPKERNITEVTAAVEAAKQQNAGGAATQNLANGGFDNRESNNGDNEADSRPTSSATKGFICLTSAIAANCFRLCPKSKTDTDAYPQGTIPPELPSQLEKLDLQCFPHLDAPKWLMDKKLDKLKKLYIRGGMLRDLGQYGLQEKKEWTVKILRLKFLNNLDMDWRELMRLFPKLIYLEKVRCPKLTFFPCDEQGVWMNKLAKSK
ncbi:hypothetical protein Vadar_007487 [Vaccinium darrowii]|uniref:Uncharacterized protein n=1 Tax=Vaccinium darrowii TaxID=229202 RepID=A0ACB7YM11_9ERIC|nr:hypothetical protein Vadar_007487 [Vaccinium darrowii]